MKQYLYAGIALAIAGLLLTAYLKGRSDGKEVVQAILDEQRLTWQTAYDKAAAETARLQGEWNRILGERDGLQERLAAATDYGNSLGERLLHYQRTSRCRVSETAAPAAGTDETARVDSLDERIGAVTTRIFAACAVEGSQLEEVLSRYEAARMAQ